MGPKTHGSGIEAVFLAGMRSSGQAIRLAVHHRVRLWEYTDYRRTRAE